MPPVPFCRRPALPGIRHHRRPHLGVRIREHDTVFGEQRHPRFLDHHAHVHGGRPARTEPATEPIAGTMPPAEHQWQHTGKCQIGFGEQEFTGRDVDGVAASQFWLLVRSVSGPAS